MKYKTTDKHPDYKKNKIIKKTASNLYGMNMVNWTDSFTDIEITSFESFKNEIENAQELL